MFTPRQLLGHLYLVEGLKRLKPEILGELGQEKGRAVATYLQFAIDKGLDYNSKQTRWEFTRGVVKGTFSRHDFSLKWTFGEMVFTGPNSGAAWGLSQILDAYKGIAALTARPRLSETVATEAKRPKLTILNGTAAHLPGVADASVDLVCMDPPYYTRRTPNPGLRSTRLETPGCVGSKRSLFRTNNSGYSSRSTTNYLASGEAVPGTPIQALQKPRFDVRRV